MPRFSRSGLIGESTWFSPAPFIHGNTTVGHLTPLDWIDAEEAARIDAIQKKIAQRRDSSKRSGLPSIPSNIDPGVEAFLRQIREVLEVRDAQRGSPLDAAPTFQDLINSGVITLDGLNVNGRSFTADQIRNLISSTTPDWVTSQTAPPTATGLVVSSLPTAIEVAWDSVSDTFQNFGYTEVWRASNANNLSLASRLGTTNGALLVDALPPPSIEYYYWVRHVSRNGLVGGFQSVAGVSWSDAPGLIDANDITITVTDGVIELEWPEPASVLDIKYYLIYALDAEGDPITPPIGRSNTNWFEFRPNAIGTYKFGIMPIAISATEPVSPVAEDLTATQITTTSLAAPAGLSHQIIGNKIELSWGSPANLNDGTTLRLERYEIWHTAVGTGTLVQTLGGLTNRFRIPIDYSNETRTFYVVAVDSAGTRGTAASIAIEIILITAPGSFAVAIEGEDLRVSWANPTSLLPLLEFEVQYGSVGFAWDAGTVLPRVSANSLLVRPTWNGSREFKVRAYDINGNAGNIASVTHSISGQGTPTGFRTDVVDNNVLLYWTPAAQTTTQLPVKSFEVRRGDSSSTWETATAVGTKQGSFTTIFESVAGTYRYHIAAVDSAGQYGTSTSTVAAVSEPPDYILNASLDEQIGGIVWDFDDNTVEGWTGTNATVTAANTVLTVDATGSDPQLLLSSMPSMVDYGRQYFMGCEWQTLQVRLRRTAGTGSETGTGYAKLSYGRTDANGANSRSPNTTSYYKQSDVVLPTAGGDWVILTFDMSSLTAGTTDWLVSRITSLRFDFGATSADDFVVDWIRALPFKLSNMVLDGLIPKLYGPVDPTAKFETDFLANPSWTSVGYKETTAGFSHFLEKSATSGYIEKIIDYGTTLPGIKATTLMTSTVVDGAVTITPTISISNTSATAGYTDNAGLQSIFATNFRWLKMRWDFAATANDDILEISAHNTKTDAKIKNDMGMGTVSVAASGATVTFNVDFVDVQSITVSPKGSASGVIAIYDFTDVPNPTSFTVYLFNTSGTKITGDFSWAARGY